MRHIFVAEMACITSSTPLLVLPATVVLFSGRHAITLRTIIGWLVVPVGVGHIIRHPL